RDGLRGDPGLVSSCTQHRPQIVLAEQPVCRTFHVGDVFDVGAYPSPDAENRLDQEGRFYEPAVDEMRGGIKMADVIAFDFKSGAVTIARLQDVGDILEGIAKDSRLRVPDVLFFPVVLVIL